MSILNSSLVYHSGATPAGKLEAARGARRIRRTITITNPEDGTQTIREIIYTDRDKVCTDTPWHASRTVGTRPCFVTCT